MPASPPPAPAMADKAGSARAGGKCGHNREKRLCRECGGWAICEHNRRRSYCKECGGSAICQHSRQRSKCKECGGVALKKCEHGRLKSSTCKRCREASLCQHQQKRKQCSDCKPFRDLGAEGMAVQVHDLLSLLEGENFPYASQARRAEILSKMARLRAFANSHAPAPTVSDAGDDAHAQLPAPPVTQDQHQHMLAAPYFPPAMAGGTAVSQAYPHPFAYYPPSWTFGAPLYPPLNQVPARLKQGLTTKRASSLPHGKNGGLPHTLSSLSYLLSVTLSHPLGVDVGVRAFHDHVLFRAGEKKSKGRPGPKTSALGGVSKKKRGKCKHNRERRLCKECGGWALCEHNRRKSHCKDCRGTAMCIHQRQKTQCKECGGSAICTHKRRKMRCHECLAALASKTLEKIHLPQPTPRA